MEKSDLEKIRGHLAVVLGMGAGDLAASIRQLDILKETTSGHLAHYLAKRSYQKAWQWIEGGEPEKGICGGRH